MITGDNETDDNYPSASWYDERENFVCFINGERGLVYVLVSMASPTK